MPSATTGTAAAAGEDRHDFIWPPAHRLLVVFDSSELADAAKDWLRGEELTGEDVWRLEGADGIAVIDEAGTQHGISGRLVHLVEWALTTLDVEYRELLSTELRAGHVVLAIRLPNEGAADLLARKLQSRGGHSMRFGAHLDFVPIVA